jgi:hypothetical protein
MSVFSLWWGRGCSQGGRESRAAPGPLLFMAMLLWAHLFSSSLLSSDYTPAAGENPDTRGVILDLRDVSLVAQEPSPMAGAAEGV